MSADMYAWEPALKLDPKAADFSSRVDMFCNPQLRQTPTPRMVRFVESLLEKYPDLTIATPDGATVWADGPLIGDASGGFINVSIIWPRYGEAAAYFIATASAEGLFAYDPQSDQLYPPRPGIIDIMEGAAEDFLKPKYVLSLGIVAAMLYLRRRKIRI